MHRSPAMNLIHRQILSHQTQTAVISNKLRLTRPCDVFINHRSIDTKRTVASLLYDQLRWLKLRPFLDKKSMKPGDKLFDKIDIAIKECKIGIAIFSPSYCQSYFCLHELALMMELKKKVIPIFCDIKPSQLTIVDNGNVPEKEVHRFNSALEEAKYTVGLAFDSHKGNWSDVVTSAAEIVIDSLIELQEEKKKEHPIIPHQNTGFSPRTK
ncbi:unnamed protein product [Camellia sinensis]|uniref:TIR domain-containing protein n=2 Tax=Camellia sinensis TaxID=4442 RepID=A0A7J7HD36_CAMSI|nr:protein PHLOEM PROTEIN 2-LIKE A5-like [Camellia sinensis]KAF5949716.1 hypothetical protein HYC85_011709 [Camellia sinensis]THG20391.1 hypothetical protein TEA_013233 [Camellia sinensis var. sinensis]